MRSNLFLKYFGRNLKLFKVKPLPTITRKGRKNFNLKCPLVESTFKLNRQCKGFLMAFCQLFLEKKRTKKGWFWMKKADVLLFCGRTCFYLEDIGKQERVRGVMNLHRLAGQSKYRDRQMLLNISITTVDCYIFLYGPRGCD